MDSLLLYFKKHNPLSEAAINAISEICTPINIKKNKDLQPIGHTCKTIYFIQKGAARIYYYKNGNDITECFVFENRIIARVESLFTGKPSQKAIEIIEDATIIAINATQLLNCIIPFQKLNACSEKSLKRLMFCRLIGSKVFNFILPKSVI